MLTELLITTGIILFVRRLLARRRKHPLPPGPKGWPLIGNLFDIPSSYEWELYAKWGEKWGDLLSLSVFGTTIVVINSYKRCQEMLDKKGNLYSDRPYMPMAAELIEMRDSMGFLPFNKRFKSYRRLFHQELGSYSAIKCFFPHEEELAKGFLKRVLRNPDDLLDHCFQHAGAIILRIAYGHEVKEVDDPFVKIANRAMDNFNRAIAPGAFLVNQLPILLKVPDWFPGTKWKNLGRTWAKDYWAMVDMPFQAVKEQLAEGTAEDSFTAKWLRRNLSTEEERDLKFASSSMFGAGSETTAVTLYAFFQLMAMFPAVQSRARAEISLVVGQDRLPSFEDRDRLPYVEAVCKEVMRYHAVVPNGLPHCTTSDNIHDGMFIPKGAIIFANIWSMTHDPTVYQNPMDFNPERFLGDSPEQDPKDIIFGFGRSYIDLYTGRLLGEVSVFITLAMCLAALDIASLDGESSLSLKNKTGIVRYVGLYITRGDHGIQEAD
ncbi:hypothetical protein GYMLUDRAFT_1018177 [Collybiopsis luxurians FD-317 M1]|uniref:Unplaced genomic scaffold GYMLUscaffold_58, whole genome shotgun sequence n=1 Tax=Collybiopsis luxurians FD-317 M1 TaxID=944289 RepID=A0A0D0AXY3_9AGAR|nr:hypothetical protein GYMLUDRAFT_1018177 [Collybiopsis luxurians FD-317 M1]